jgi:hypothetical protein
MVHQQHKHRLRSEVALAVVVCSSWELELKEKVDRVFRGRLPFETVNQRGLAKGEERRDEGERTSSDLFLGCKAPPHW